MTAVLAQSELGVARRVEISCSSALVVSAVVVLFAAYATQRLKSEFMSLLSLQERRALFSVTSGLLPEET